MTAPRKSVRKSRSITMQVVTAISILCLLMLSGCVRQVTSSRDKKREKMVEIPARLGIELDAEREQVIGTIKNSPKDIKSGMAYKPATFLFGHSANAAGRNLVGGDKHGEYEDIPLPIGVTDIRYEIGQEQGHQQRNGQNGAADWCVTDWCAQGQCAGDSALYYTVEQSLEQLINFYVCNMERLGWHLTADFYSRETILFFDRYDKRCAIFLSPDNSKSGKSSWSRWGYLDRRGTRNKGITHVAIFVSLRTALL